mgnify:CR=1 FL=1
MDKEGIPLQFDMFSGELVDNRTTRQKKQDKERQQPKQIEMFASREIAQFGINPRPLLPLSPNTKLLLIPEDPRTDEEIEQDRQREAEKHTIRMFGESRSSGENIQSEEPAEGTEPDTETLALVPRGVVALVLTDHFSRFQPL